MRSRLFLLWFLILSVVLAGSSTACAGPAKEVTPEAFERVVNAYHEAGQFDGVVHVIRDGKPVYSGGSGPANRSWNIDNDADSRFRICSLTKQFTAVLIMQLVGDGKIDLDATITTCLPWYRRDTGERITVRQLLQHMSGLPEAITEFDQLDDAMLVVSTPKLFVQQFASGDLDFEPGTAFAYSNADFYVLGTIIEAVTGQPYADVLQTRILDPLDMQSTGMLAVETVVPRMATGYRRVGDTYEHRLYLGQPGYAAAGMYSTANDLGKWNVALLDHAILSADLTDQMFTPVVVDGDTGSYVALGSWVYQRPLPKDDTIAPRLVERRGYVEPFTALSVLCPDDRHAFVILSNTDPCDLHTLPWAGGLPLDLLQMLYGQNPDGPAIQE